MAVFFSEKPTTLSGPHDRSGSLETSVKDKVDGRYLKVMRVTQHHHHTQTNVYTYILGFVHARMHEEEVGFIYAYLGLCTQASTSKSTHTRLRARAHKHTVPRAVRAGTSRKTLDQSARQISE